MSRCIYIKRVGGVLHLDCLVTVMQICDQEGVSVERRWRAATLTGLRLENVMVITQAYWLCIGVKVGMEKFPLIGHRRGSPIADPPVGHS